jgi:hypothetical protein
LAACARVSIEGGRIYGSSRWEKTAKMERDIAKYVGAGHPIYVT